MNIKLSSLNPRLKDNILVFDCPVCGDHPIRVPLKPAPPNRFEASWDHKGEFPDTLTVTPSVDAGCWHGNITNGKVDWT